MSNGLGDLDDHLFAALNRLSVDTLTPEQMEQECRRADSIVAVADKVVANATVKLNAARLFAQHGKGVMQMLPQIGRAPAKAEDAP